MQQNRQESIRIEEPELCLETEGDLVHAVCRIVSLSSMRELDVFFPLGKQIESMGNSTFLLNCSSKVNINGNAEIDKIPGQFKSILIKEQMAAVFYTCAGNLRRRAELDKTNSTELRIIANKIENFLEKKVKVTRVSVKDLISTPENDEKLLMAKTTEYRKKQLLDAQKNGERTGQHSKVVAGILLFTAAAIALTTCNNQPSSTPDLQKSSTHQPHKIQK